MRLRRYYGLYKGWGPGFDASHCEVLLTCDREGEYTLERIKDDWHSRTMGAETYDTLEKAEANVHRFLTFYEKKRIAKQIKRSM